MSSDAKGWPRGEPGAGRGWGGELTSRQKNPVQSWPQSTEVRVSLGPG